VAAVFLVAADVCAHELQPALLEITETTPGLYDILFRTPLVAGRPLPVALQFPDFCANATEPRAQVLANAAVERRVVDATAGELKGERILFLGLQATRTDVLVRATLHDGTQWTVIARPAQPWVEFTGAKTAWEVARTYLLHGIQHILFGVDHLLFVFGLLLIVKRKWMLLKTVTAFTVAHSITLAIATLGVANVPAAPLNALIALSILFLGPEIVRTWRGETSLTIRHPWVVAFVFGLLHGFGFASALTGAGLPRSALPLALFTFNVGVEIGQVAFVLIVLGVMRSFRQLEFQWTRWSRMAPGYAVGTFGAMWTIQRVVAMHPVSGLDHVVAMLAVGLWGAQIGAPAIWLLPVTFPVVMAFGGMLGLMGVGLPGIEIGIAVSAVILGAMVLLEVRPSLAIAAVLVGFFAIFHGHAHGTELPEGANGMLYSVGFVVSTGCIHAAGITVGLVHRWPMGRLAIRAGGLAIALTGMGFLWRALV
jgi:hydrogenase/urease accessory protein HupE